MPNQSLLDPKFLRKLEMLRIQARRAFPGTMRGERRSTRRGASVEFADFRQYQAGDDFRHVDWNIYARLERLMLRQFVEEEDVRIDILIDQSKSMHYGTTATKFDFARRTAATLAFLGISSLDQVGVAMFDSTLRGRLRASRGRGHLMSILNFLERHWKEDNSPSPNPASEAAGEEKPLAFQPAERTNLKAVLKNYQKATSRSGILFVISDFFDDSDFRAELRLLAQRKFDVNLIQALADEEMNPQVTGDWLMVDSESGEEREMTANDRTVTVYKRMLDDFTESLESFSRKSGIGYTLIQASAAFEDVLLKRLMESRMAG